MKLIRFADVLGAWQIGEFFVRIVVFFFFWAFVYLYDLTWHRLS